MVFPPGYFPAERKYTHFSPAKLPMYCAPKEPKFDEYVLTYPPSVVPETHMAGDVENDIG